MKKVNKPSSISLLTYNTLGVPFLAPDTKHRSKIIAAELERSTFDVVFFQEIFTHHRVSLFKKWLPSYPYCVFKKSFVGPLGGLVIFSKLPITFDSYSKYPIPKKVKAPWYTRLSRNGLLIAHFRDIPLTLMTTHLTSERHHHLTPQNKYYKLISSQAFIAARTIREYAKGSRDVILAGDFNIAKDTELYHAMITKARVKDISERETIPTYFHDRIDAKYNALASDRIDHIFISNTNRHTSVASRVMHLFNEKFRLHNKKESYLSDHIGLGCKIIVKK